MDTDDENHFEYALGFAIRTKLPASNPALTILLVSP
jgi:hypothetical protein